MVAEHGICGNSVYAAREEKAIAQVKTLPLMVDLAVTGEFNADPAVAGIAIIIVLRIFPSLRLGYVHGKDWGAGFVGFFLGFCGDRIGPDLRDPAEIDIQLVRVLRPVFKFRAVPSRDALEVPFLLKAGAGFLPVRVLSVEQISAIWESGQLEEKTESFPDGFPGIIGDLGCQPAGAALPLPLRKPLWLKIPAFDWLHVFICHSQIGRLDPGFLLRLCRGFLVFFGDGLFLPAVRFVGRQILFIIGLLDRDPVQIFECTGWDRIRAGLEGSLHFLFLRDLFEAFQKIEPVFFGDPAADPAAVRLIFLHPFDDLFVVCFVGDIVRKTIPKNSFIADASARLFGIRSIADADIILLLVFRFFEHITNT